MTQIVLLREKKKDILSADLILTSPTSKLLWTSSSFLYNPPISSYKGKTKALVKVPGIWCIFVEGMPWEWQLLLPQGSYKRTSSWNPGPLQDPWYISSTVNPRDSPLKQQSRMRSPSRRDLFISEGGRSRLGQKAASYQFIHLPDWASVRKARGGDTVEILQRLSCFYGNQWLSFLFLANWGERDWLGKSRTWFIPVLSLSVFNAMFCGLSIMPHCGRIQG